MEKERKSKMVLSKVIFSSASHEYRTPKYLYDKLNAEFNFELDPCTTEDNPLNTKYFYTKETDGLGQDWSFAKSIFINPRYGRIVDKWVKKAIKVSVW
jgi:site-specific DNA-methyltransferase (adenine-specific)